MGTARLTCVRKSPRTSRNARSNAGIWCWSGAVAMGLVAAGCTALPRAEITAYTSAYSEILTITNGVLDIVSPYERIVIRNSAATPLTVYPVSVAAAGSIRRSGRRTRRRLKIRP